MARFRYTAMDTGGKRVAGVVAGQSEQSVLAELEARQLVPVRVEAKHERMTLRRGVSARALGQSYAQLADLLRAGVPVLRSLKLLGRKKSQPRLSAVFRELAERISQGGELADGMAEHPEIFNDVQIAMIRAGEKGGFLEEVLDRLGRFVLGQAELRSKIIGNLIYPSVLVVIGSIVLGVIFGYFIPLFRPLFDRIEGGLPAVTRMVFAVSEAVGTYGPITLIALVLAGIGLWRASKRPRVRRLIAEVRTRMPVLGPLTRAIAAARFCRMLGTLLGNGVPMIQSMAIARDASGNVLMEEAIDAATEAVRAGENLAPPLAASGLFPDDIIEMIAVGESANNLDTVLVTIAQTIEQRIDRLVSSAVRLIEPLLLALLAGAIVFVAMGLILPMTKLSAGM